MRLLEIMKYCPKCQKNYDDDSYEFCLQDGTGLVNFSTSQMPTVFLSETETVIRSPQVQPLPPSFQNLQDSAPTDFPPVQPIPPKSNTAKIVLLTIIGMLALFGAAFGAWFFLGKGETEIAENTNSNVNSTRTPSPKPSTSSSVNKTKSTISPTPEFDAEQIESEVSSTIDAWKSASESLNLDSHLSNYADTVDYYNKSKANRSTIRADKQRAFAKYDTIKINMTNLNITPDANGERATAVFDKEWTFTSSEGDYNSGKVSQKLILKKNNNQWLITSEKDLKVYYIRK